MTERIAAMSNSNSERASEVIAFGSVPPDEIVERLTTSGVVWARARSPLEVWEHEQLAARDRFMSVAVEDGEVRTFKPPFNISGCPDPWAHVPALGDHDPGVVETLVARAHTAGQNESGR